MRDLNAAQPRRNLPLDRLPSLIIRFIFGLKIRSRNQASVNADVDFAAVTVGNLVFLHGILRNLGFNTIQVLIGLLF